MMKRTGRLVAYLFVPLIFTLISAGIIYGTMQKPMKSVKVMINMFVGEQPPVFEDTQQPDHVSANSVHIPKHGAFYGNMYCERFGYSGKIYYGADERILKKGIGQKQESSLPGYGGITVLYGHNDTSFWFLKELESGDIVKIDTAYGEYEYRVTEAKVGCADNASELYPTDNGNDKLVMCTEYPFKSNKKTLEDIPQEEVPEGTHKIIWAEKISGPSVLGQEAA